MRALRGLGLVVIVTITGLFSGAAAGAAPTTAAIVATVSGLLPSEPAGATAAPAAQPAVTAPPAPTAAPEVLVPAPAPVPVPAAPVRATVPVVPVRVVGTPCRATARACVELSSNRAWLIRNGVVAYGPVPITHGRKGWRTPPGTFAVTFTDKNHRSSLFDDAPMPYSVFFNGGIAFHQGSLTTPSHGCIHLSRAAAQIFFGALSRGDTVQVAT